MRHVTVGLVAALLCPAVPAVAQEHGSTPKEHMGGTGGLAPAGGFPTADQGDARFTAEQIKAALSEYIDRKLQEDGGVFRITDDQTGEKLELEFRDIAIVGVAALWRIHDPTRTLENRGYFACTDFHPVGAPEDKVYDIDAYLSPHGGKLEVTQFRIHKEPRFVNGKWVKVARFTRTRAASQ